MNFIAENEKYKVYSLDESIYLKEKSLFKNHDKFSNEDKFIGHHYGNPNDGIITENYVIVSGCGISIYDLMNKTDRHLFTDENNRYWTNGIHQEGEDDYHTEFRFVSNNSDNKLRVFKMNIQTEKLTELE
jgi:hypothetical protein